MSLVALSLSLLFVVQHILSQLSLTMTMSLLFVRKTICISLSLSLCLFLCGLGAVQVELNQHCICSLEGILQVILQLVGEQPRGIILSPHLELSQGLLVLLQLPLVGGGILQVELGRER